MRFLSLFRKFKQKPPGETIQPPGGRSKQLTRIEQDVKALHVLLSRHDQGIRDHITLTTQIQRAKRKTAKAINLPEMKADLDNGVTPKDIVIKFKSRGLSKSTIYRMINDLIEQRVEQSAE